MASNQRTIDALLDQLPASLDVTARKMFGEYGIYSAGKLFGLVCDDQLFIKPTSAGPQLHRTAH